MLKKLREIFSVGSKNESKNDSEDEDVVPLSAAMVLLEVAWADHELEQKELDLIRGALESLYKVDKERALDILKRAQQEHEQSVSVYPFTRELNERLTLEERRTLLVHLWRMNDFDGSAFHYEESVIRKTSELLNLRHSEFIAAKLAAKQN